MFVHLHLHTEFSLLDGAARIKEVVKAAKNLNMPALAITDHGCMFGIVDFYRACLKEEIKPILGCEVYVAPKTMQDKDSKNMYHLVLLAENQIGYCNLLEIVSTAYVQGFYYKPRTDKEFLRTHSQGLIALSACIAGEVPAALIQDDYEKARNAALEMQEIFGVGNFFLEVQNHATPEKDFPEQRVANRGLWKLHQETGIPMVATNDVHYVYREWAEMQDILMCIQMGKTFNDPERMKFESTQLYLKSEEEMTLALGEYPEALANTWEIAQRCQVELTFGAFHLPEFLVPEGYTLDSYLRHKCEEGLVERYGQGTEEIWHRMDYELGVIKKMGYSAYFLIVWDFIHFAKSQGIPVGPGRGSAAGSIVAYLLGITDLDPLKYDLLFERFLNPERVSMPDIDVDICYERRGEVIQYVTGKYGADKVSQIAAFGTMAARGAIRDVGRVLDMPYSEVDQISKLIPMELHITIQKALENSSELRGMYDEDPQIRKLIDTAILIEGMPRHVSTHAAGVVITNKPLTHYIPLYKASNGPLTTQFAKDQVEDLGLLKMDLLGLRTLTVIADCLKLIKKNFDLDLDLEHIPLDDTESYQMLCRGEGVGVFQLESSGMRNLLKDLRPEVFEDLIALVAIFRPGPLGSGMVDDFIKNKHGLQKVTYLHPLLEPILKDTYGMILYQEQVMRISSDLAGFTLGEADMLRRAMGKKKPEIIAGLRKQFVDGAVANQVEEQIAGQIFDLMEYFAGYGFNKSHSAAYALVSYQTAYLKAHYPVEFMAALLTSVRDNTDKVIAYIEECRRMGIEVLPPDINESMESFTAVGGKIRFGLAAIKNVGFAAVELLIKQREENGLYKSFGDFCCNLDTRAINKRIVENLIKAGSFASLGHGRNQLLQVLDQGLNLAQKKQKERQSGQLSLFDFWETEEDEVLEIPSVREYSQAELLQLEKEALGLYISGHPLEEYRQILASSQAIPIIELKDNLLSETVRVGGTFQTIKQLTTKKGDPMAFAQLEDLTGSLEIVIFPKVFQKYQRILKTDQPILLEGKINFNGEDDLKIVAEKIQLLENKDGTKKIELYIKIDGLSQFELGQVKILLRNYSGKVPVLLYDQERHKLFRTSQEYWVDLNDSLLNKLETIAGKANVRVKEEH